MPPRLSGRCSRERSSWQRNRRNNPAEAIGALHVRVGAQFRPRKRGGVGRPACWLGRRRALTHQLQGQPLLGHDGCPARLCVWPFVVQDTSPVCKRQGVNLPMCVPCFVATPARPGRDPISPGVVSRAYAVYHSSLNAPVVGHVRGTVWDQDHQIDGGLSISRPLTYLCRTLDMSAW